MAKYALVHKDETRVQGVSLDENGRFDVHSDLTWYPCPDEVEFMWDYNKETGEFTPPKKTLTEYVVARKVGYGDIGSQLDKIFKAVKNGEDDPLAAWAAHVEKVKMLFPKDNHAAVNAANDEMNRRVAQMHVDMDNGGRFIPPDEMTAQLADDYMSGRWINPELGPYKP